MEQGDAGLLPQFDVQVNLDHIGTELRQSQLACVLVTSNKLTQLARQKQHASLRPHQSIKSAPRAWWKFAVQASLDHWLKRRREMSWEYIKARQRTRMRYIPLYTEVRTSISSLR